MPFDPNPFMIRVQGNKKYLPVAGRILWFRHDHPEWGIVTEPVEINHEKQFAIYRATIFDDKGKVIATATKMENIKGFGDWLEKAETGAVGRALAYAGYGTDAAPELDEMPRLADAPSDRQEPRREPERSRQVERPVQNGARPQNGRFPTRERQEEPNRKPPPGADSGPPKNGPSDEEYKFVDVAREYKWDIQNRDQALSLLINVLRFREIAAANNPRFEPDIEDWQEGIVSLPEFTAYHSAPGDAAEV